MTHTDIKKLVDIGDDLAADVARSEETLASVSGKSIETNSVLARFSNLRGDSEACILATTKVLEHEPQNREMLTLRAGSYLKTGQKNLARVDLQELLKSVNDPEERNKIERALNLTA